MTDSLTSALTRLLGRNPVTDKCDAKAPDFRLSCILDKGHIKTVDDWHEGHADSFTSQKTVLDRFDTEAITREAKQVKFTTTLLRVIAFVIFWTAWCLPRLLGVLWLAGAWFGVVFKMGWQEGAKGTPFEKRRLPARA
jgi:hypothetical protein